MAAIAGDGLQHAIAVGRRHCSPSAPTRNAASRYLAADASVPANKAIRRFGTSSSRALRIGSSHRPDGARRSCRRDSAAWRWRGRRRRGVPRNAFGGRIEARPPRPRSSRFRRGTSGREPVNSHSAVKATPDPRRGSGHRAASRRRLRPRQCAHRHHAWLPRARRDDAGQSSISSVFTSRDAGREWRMRHKRVGDAGSPAGARATGRRIARLQQQVAARGRNPQQAFAIADDGDEVTVLPVAQAEPAAAEAGGIAVCLFNGRSSRCSSGRTMRAASSPQVAACEPLPVGTWSRPRTPAASVTRQCRFSMSAGSRRWRRSPPPPPASRSGHRHREPIPHSDSPVECGPTPRRAASPASAVADGGLLEEQPHAAADRWRADQLQGVGSLPASPRNVAFDSARRPRPPDALGDRRPPLGANAPAGPAVSIREARPWPRAPALSGQGDGGPPARAGDRVGVAGSGKRFAGSSSGAQSPVESSSARRLQTARLHRERRALDSICARARAIPSAQR